MICMSEKIYIKLKMIETLQNNSPKRFTCMQSTLCQKTFTVVCEKRLQNLTFTERSPIHIKTL